MARTLVPTVGSPGRHGSLSDRRGDRPDRGTAGPAGGAGGRRTGHRCRECGSETPRWWGRCPACGAWGSVVEIGGDPAPAGAVPLDEVAAGTWERWRTGIGELDRVLGGGLVPAAAVVLGGAPGLGKSTLVLQALGGLAAAGRRCLLVTAEEPAAAVAARARRLQVPTPGVLVQETGDLAAIVDAFGRHRPHVLVVDSIQTVRDPQVGSAAGTPAQVRAVAEACVSAARRAQAAVWFVGHVTKDGSLAGPRTLEHLVDTVLAFEGDRHHTVRFLRAAKHRHGPTRELGVLEMGPQGLVGVEDPSRLFLADRHRSTPGSVVAAALQGTRPVLVEVQALSVPARGGAPRRWAQGFDAARLTLLGAVIEARAGLRLSDGEVFANLAGGVQIDEPGLDLAVCLAVASARLGAAVPTGLVVAGEVGLAGEVRQVARLPDRLAEAARLGFTTALVPAAGRVSLPPVELGARRVMGVRSLVEALGAVGLAPVTPGPDRTRC